jgi:hypothetical protein
LGDASFLQQRVEGHEEAEIGRVHGLAMMRDERRSGQAVGGWGNREHTRRIAGKGIACGLVGLGAGGIEAARIAASRPLNHAGPRTAAVESRL